MPEIHFDRFYRYAELTQLLQGYAQEYPNLVRLDSLGKSYEGRDIWVLTVTNAATGPDNEKPAFWVDGNIHATEVSASTACLYFINQLVTTYGTDDEVTRCLDTRAFYICPRQNPDGAEWALADIPRYIRSSTRLYPYLDEPQEGLFEEDIDGDGRILTMRVRDPHGSWKIHPDEPRLMVRREPTETGGTYYRLLPEGRVKNYDGVTIQVQPPQQKLDLNRNFPADWRQDYEQRGAGPYPTSEPEVRAFVDFQVQHPNITGGVSFHTYSGVLLRPHAGKPDDAFPAEDLWTYQKIGQKGTEITGYPNISIFHDFKYHPKQVISGGADWMFEHRGAFYWAVEIWAPMREAGIKDYKYIDWFREHPDSDELLMLKWNDEVLGGVGFVNWYPFQHPELGAVELGGWHDFAVIGNPPKAFLEKEVSRFPKWLTWQALISPRLELHSATVTSLGEGLYRVRMVVENTGWLPTYVTQTALERKIVRGVIAEIELPEGARLEGCLARQELGQLEGRAYKTASIDTYAEASSNRVKIEWLVVAPLNAAQGGTVKLVARHERAGIVRTAVELR